MNSRHGQGAEVAGKFELLASNMGKVLQGKEEVVRQAATCMVCEGHLLVEDVPGVGKTTLARALAKSVQLAWNRIQFTPDLLPSDITGVSVFNQATSDFEFRPGPVFANIVLGDEINRASPKVQSALLEVMEERTVTTDTMSFPVPRPFMVVATQNPIDMEGTYSLPEAQLDRFLMRISIGYPSADAESTMLKNEKDVASVDDLRPVMSENDLLWLIDQVKLVAVAPAIERYIVGISEYTRNATQVRLGVSPRGSLALLRAARATAASSGREFVTPEDVKLVAMPVLEHRILIHPEAELQGHGPEEVVRRALLSVPVPRKTDV